MFKTLEWEDVYKLWQYGRYDFPQSLSASITATTVFVEYNQDGYFYGYDWLQNEEAQERIKLIEENPIQFLYFTKPSNKGTIQTAEMLMAAQTEEEIAAIWIAATTKELVEYKGRNDVARYAHMLHGAACDFLRPRYYLWHHAMKKLVPEIMIPRSVVENIVCKDAEPVMGLIQMNTALLKSAWSFLRYSSLKDGMIPDTNCRVDKEIS